MTEKHLTRAALSQEVIVLGRSLLGIAELMDELEDQSLVAPYEAIVRAVHDFSDATIEAWPADEEGRLRRLVRAVKALDSVQVPWK